MVLMDAFVPPGYMAVGELLRLASQAILKEDWLEPIEFVARARRRREVKRPRGFLKVHRELRRAGATRDRNLSSLGCPKPCSSGSPGSGCSLIACACPC
jgi:hypothetical protein